MAPSQHRDLFEVLASLAWRDAPLAAPPVYPPLPEAPGDAEEEEENQSGNDAERLEGTVSPNAAKANSEKENELFPEADGDTADAALPRDAADLVSQPKAARQNSEKENELFPEAACSAAAAVSLQSAATEENNAAPEEQLADEKQEEEQQKTDEEEEEGEEAEEGKPPPSEKQLAGEAAEVAAVSLEKARGESTENATDNEKEVTKLSAEDEVPPSPFPLPAAVLAERATLARRKLANGLWSGWLRWPPRGGAHYTPVWSIPLSTAVKRDDDSTEARPNQKGRKQRARKKREPLSPRLGARANLTKGSHPRGRASQNSHLALPST